MCWVRNGNHLKSCVSEIRVKQIRINQGIGVNSRKQGFKSEEVGKNFWKICDVIYECPPILFFTVDICEHLTNWWHKNPFEGASEKWFRKRRGTRNVSNYAWPWPIFVQCDTKCPFVLMIFERNSQKDSKKKGNDSY